MDNNKRNLILKKFELLWILLGLIIIGLLFLFPIISKISTHIFADDIFKEKGFSDAYMFLWSFWWGDYSLKNHLPLFMTQYIYPPFGQNLFFHALLPFQSFLMFPVTRLLGIVTSFNILIIFMMTMACFVYYLFLRKNFDFKPLVCFIVAVLFGFHPYFITKMQGHLNMINAAIWGAALAVLITSYLKNKFKWHHGVMFALFFWLTLYTSFVEFFILLISTFIIIVSFEIYSLIKEKKVVLLKDKIIYYLPLIIGSLSFFYLMSFAPKGDIANYGLYKGFYLRDFFNFPRYNILGSLTHWIKWDSEYWGIYYTYTAMILCFSGIYFWWKSKKFNNSIILIILTIIMFFIVWDKRDIASTIIRSLPFSGGFRVFARFFSVLIFLSLPFVAFSLNKIVTSKNRYVSFIVTGLVIISLIIEIFPFNLQPRPIKNFVLSNEDYSRIDPSKYVLIMAEKKFMTLHDTYQATSGLKMVYYDDLSRENALDKERRENFAPMIYHFDDPLKNTLEYSKELSNLNVGYILFENKKDPRRNIFNGKIVVEKEAGILLELTDYQIHSNTIITKNGREG